MKIILIGSGNVANHLGPALKRAGHRILQVFGRSEKSASALAAKLSCQYTTKPEFILPNGDLYLLLLRDEVIESFLKYIPGKSALVVHTSGSVPISVFKNKFIKYGVLYPVQTFSLKKKINLSKVPFCIEADSIKTEKKLRLLIKPVSRHIHKLDSKQRLILHLAAVLSNNFSNHLFTLSEKLLAKYNLEFDLLRPLILETAQKVQHNSPKEMQTGPAKRGDTGTIDTHLEILKGQTYLHEIYRLLTESIEDLSGPRL